MEYADIVFIFQDEEKVQMFLNELTKVILSFGMYIRSASVIVHVVPKQYRYDQRKVMFVLNVVHKKVSNEEDSVSFHLMYLLADSTRLVVSLPRVTACFAQVLKSQAEQARNDHLKLHIGLYTIRKYGPYGLDTLPARSRPQVTDSEVGRSQYKIAGGVDNSKQGVQTEYCRSSKLRNTGELDEFREAREQLCVRSNLRVNRIRKQVSSGGERRIQADRRPGEKFVLIEFIEQIRAVCELHQFYICYPQRNLGESECYTRLSTLLCNFGNTFGYTGSSEEYCTRFTVFCRCKVAAYLAAKLLYLEDFSLKFYGKTERLKIRQ
ncbi:hypothetical protein CLF_102948 [Clonorchis sinensis]|uniref:Uncharacterized protein n=1 Tax=Clonorchis sinensis TaxID=79923 RepID=G7Y8U7_CLOSI|nr:hypothetical protein CLF_102948 [Clonorchis sinensis]